MRIRPVRVAAVAAAASVLLAVDVRAETLYGLWTNGHLVSFDTAAPASVTDRGALSGLPASRTMFAIDFRPGTGTLYGVGVDPASGAGNLYTINPATAAVTLVPGDFTLNTAAPLTNFQVGFDFHPSGTYGQLITANGDNYRVTLGPATTIATQTALAFAAGDTNAGDTPSTTRIAFSNANPSQAYGYDYQNDAIVRIGGGNDAGSGVLSTVGSSGIVARASGIGFEFSNLGGSDVGYLTLSTGVPNTDPEQFVRQLYTLNTATGAVSAIGPVGTNLEANGISIGSLTAAVDVTTPEPASLATLAATLGVLSMRRRPKGG